MVARCAVHGHAFTVYPPGFTPYGRLALVAIAYDGGEVATLVVAPAAADPVVAPAAADPAVAPATTDSAEEPPPAVADTTCFSDARRASIVEPGVRAPGKGGSRFWWQTQRRRLAAAVRLCGVAVDLNLADRLGRARALEVAVQVLADAAAAIAAAPGYRSRGCAVVAVLDAMSGPAATAFDRLRRLLAAGHLAGLWGPPYLWDRAARRLRRWAFPEAGTRPP